MALDLDLGGVVSAGKPLPEGDYEFEVDDATITEAKSGESHNLKLRLVVTSDDENGRPHSENLNIQESTRPFVKAFLTALWGVEDDEIEGISFDIDEDDNTVNAINGTPLVGASIGGTVKHKTEDGRTYGNIVAWFTV